jgi:hypothetical protein
MKILIDISNAHVKKLRFWASVSRTLSTSASLLDDVDNDALNESDSERLNNAIEELRDLTVPLDALHAAFKEACMKIVTAGMNPTVALDMHSEMNRADFVSMLAPEELAAFEKAVKAEIERRG